MLVVSEEEATALKKVAYGPRSKTVHTAKLHGREAVRGSSSLGNFFGIEPAYWFEIATVRQLKLASSSSYSISSEGRSATSERGAVCSSGRCFPCPQESAPKSTVGHSPWSFHPAALDGPEQTCRTRHQT
jgi:hypothetical protein